MGSKLHKVCYFIIIIALFVCLFVCLFVRFIILPLS